MYIESGHLRDAGASGEMHDAPLLFQVGEAVSFGAETYNVMGHARFSYGIGWWDEFFAVTDRGEEVWISVDEGDVIVQRPLSPDDAPSIKTPPELGDSLTTPETNYRVTEKDTATCIAFRGEFPEVLQLGSKYEFINCQGDDDTLLSGEFSTGDPDWYTGAWLDQYSLKIETRS
ncbi:MAG: DUF4178 domain-containing protein [Paracoccaceae bacterium]